jgi:hypothetical protein
MPSPIPPQRHRDHRIDNRHPNHNSSMIANEKRGLFDHSELGRDHWEELKELQEKHKKEMELEKDIMKHFGVRPGDKDSVGHNMVYRPKMISRYGFCHIILVYWQYIGHIVSFCMGLAWNPYRAKPKKPPKYIAIYCDPHWTRRTTTASGGWIRVASRCW